MKPVATWCLQERNQNMGRDILFKTKEFVFSYRVGGLLIKNNKILLQKPQNDDFAIIGGHVSCLETTAEALKREFEEELHAGVDIDRLFAVGEVFFPWGQKVCHQICLYYKVHLLNNNDLPSAGSFHGYDDLNNERIDLDFCWIPLEEIKNGLKVYPLELMPHILNDNNGIVHFVSKQI